MKLLSAAALALLATAPTLASASGLLVDFEKQWDYLNGDINGYYSGGSAADGSSGANAGVSFVGVSGLSNDADFTYYTGAPSMLGTAYAHTIGEERAFMNVAAGVSGALSFYYSSPSSVLGAVKAYSGLNGTGILLGTFDLIGNALSGYDVWTPVTFSFSGLAESFDLTGSANLVGLDNISAVAAVPEPSTVALMLMGGVALLRTARRRQR